MRIVSLISPVLMAVFSALCGLAHGIEKGQPAPNFSLPSTNADTSASSPISLVALRGKVVYVDFWASWCGPCKQSFPWMNDMQTRYGSKGFQVVAINVDKKPSDAAGFLRATAPVFSIAYDPAGSTPQLFQVKAMPSSFLIGTDGRVIATHAGFRDADRSPLEQSIRQALGIKE